MLIKYTCTHTPTRINKNTNESTILYTQERSCVNIKQTMAMRLMKYEF